MYSFRIEQAIRAAAVLHRDQNRKGSLPLPYITHLMAVVMILLDYTTDEDTIVAAFLHDTLEDTDYTVDELREDFGGAVVEMVMTLSEPKYTGDQKLSWREKKNAYVKQLKQGSESAVLIAAADKIHNLRTVVEEYCTDHNRYLQDFGKNIDDQHEAYQSISNVINSRLKDAPIVYEFNHVFDEFKQFLVSIETKYETTV